VQYAVTRPAARLAVPLLSTLACLAHAGCQQGPQPVPQGIPAPSPESTPQETHDLPSQRQYPQFYVDVRDKRGLEGIDEDTR
jgi:hypothetical protein